MTKQWYVYFYYHDCLGNRKQFRSKMGINYLNQPNKKISTFSENSFEFQNKVFNFVQTIKA